MCDFSPTFYVMDVCDVMYAYGSGLGFWGVRFCGWYCPNVIVFLACWGTWRCELTLFCVEIVKRHLQIFIYSFVIHVSITIPTAEASQGSFSYSFFFHAHFAFIYTIGSTWVPRDESDCLSWE